jgi:hypothetical protein
MPIAAQLSLSYGIMGAHMVTDSAEDWPVQADRNRSAWCDRVPGGAVMTRMDCPPSYPECSSCQSRVNAPATGCCRDLVPKVW